VKVPSKLIGGTWAAGVCGCRGPGPAGGNACDRGCGVGGNGVGSDVDGSEVS
jgi:hypothetical protein